MLAACAVARSDSPAAGNPADAEARAVAAKAKAYAVIEKKTAEWVACLNLNDASKEVRLSEVIATDLKAVRDWHNDHSYTNVPAGINSVTGQMLSRLHRQMSADSAVPKTVHEYLMTGLRKDLNEEQVLKILDKYTVGKVDFTLRGYWAIVPDLTAEEEATILNYLQQARGQAVD